MKSKKQILSLSKPIKKISGVYFLIKDNEIVYVGQSRDTGSRISAHTRNKDFDRVYVIPCSVENLYKTEADYIKEFKPKLNVINNYEYQRRGKSPIEKKDDIDRFYFMCEKHNKIYTLDKMCIKCAREQGLLTPWVRNQPRFVDPWMGE